MTQLKKEAQVTHILPALKQNPLLSVKKLADSGYTTIFHPYQGGVTVPDDDGVQLTITKEALLQGWRDGQGLRRVPLVDKITNEQLQTLAIGGNSQCIRIAVGRESCEILAWHIGIPH